MQRLRDKPARGAHDEGRWSSLGRRLLVAWLGAEQARSTEGLANACDADPSTISKLATGAHREPSLGLAFKIYERTGIEPSAWLAERRIEGAVVTLVTRRRGIAKDNAPPRAAE